MTVEAQMAQVAQVPQIIVNQPGANLINQLLDAALKGGGLSNMTLVREVITVTNHRPTAPQEENSGSGKAPGPRIDDSKKPIPIEKKLPDNPGNKDPRAS